MSALAILLSFVPSSYFVLDERSHDMQQHDVSCINIYSIVAAAVNFLEKFRLEQS